MTSTEIQQMLEALEAIMTERAIKLEEAVPNLGGSSWTGCRGMDAIGGIERSNDVHFPGMRVAEIENIAAQRVFDVLIGMYGSNDIGHL